MKKIAGLMVIVLFTGLYASAQKAHGQGKGGPMDSARKARMEELKKYRHDLFVEKLNLTDAEEKAFFPIFDEYQLKLRETRHSFKKKWKDRKPADLTETEAEEFLADAVKMREDEVALFKTYSEKLKSAIPVKKIILIPRVEKEVQKALIEKFKELRPPKGGPGSGPHHGPPPPPEDE